MKRLTFAACEPHLDEANELFYILFGFNEADRNTFSNTTYTDGTTAYAVASCPISGAHEAILNGTLPEIPPDDNDQPIANVTLAQQALEHCQWRINVEPKQALADMGLASIPTTEATL